MKRLSFPSRRTFLAALGFGTGAAASSAAAQMTSAAASAGVDGTERGNSGTYRDPAPGGVAHPIERLLDSEAFISAYRFFSEEEIADAANYRGARDLTRPLQTALDAAWSTNRDLFLPAGLYRVQGLTMPGTAEGRNRAFRFYGQGSGELFARAESGGTIIKGVGTGPVLSNRHGSGPTGKGNQEIAYLRFEGDSSGAVVDLAALFAQSELHHCGIFQSGTGDGLRIGFANTVEVHHNYLLNADWVTAAKRRRTGTGIRVQLPSDNGLLSLRKNTMRGFDWALRLGGEGTGRIYSARVEQCEASVCANGFLLGEGVDGAVVENCYLEGGDGGTGIRNRGNGNTISNNYMFPGFSIGIDDAEPTRATRIVGNTLSAGNARTIAPGGCTLMRVNGEGGVKTVEGNSFICDPVSYGALDRVVGLELLGSAPGLQIGGNAFDPARDWGEPLDAVQVLDRSGGGGARGAVPFGPDGTMTLLSRGAVSLGRIVLDGASFAGQTLRLPPGSWFELPSGVPRTVRGFDGGAHDGRVVVLWDRHGSLRLESSPIVRLDGGRPFEGPGTITLLLQAGGGATEALEMSRAKF